MQIKELIKKIPFVRALFNVFYKHISLSLNTINLGFYTTYRTLKYYKLKNNIQGWKSSMRVSCHILEKGLTMPDKRLGYGQDRVSFVANEILNHPEHNNLSDVVIAIGILKEYDILHKENDYLLPIELQKLINNVANLYPEVESLSQIKVNIKDFFSEKESSFRNFALSRHSIRNFKGSVSLDQINDSIELALTAPSACNRQAIKCHIFNNKDMVQKILTYQNGNRGFGHLVPQLCILTVDLRMIGTNEQNDIYFNAGLFAMNLSYAFHYNKVGSCMLNWSVTPKKDKTLKKIADIPNPESVVVIFAVGIPSDNIEIARSQRKNLNDAVVYH
jgi:nitroreductase